jgi:3-dehydroquinate synthase
VLNFGHTFGHVFESITDYRVRHGEAVGLGMLCALEIGASMGVTPRTIADAVGRSLPQPQTARRTVARLTRLRSVDQIESLLKADKKSDGAGLRMVLLTALGRWQLVDVSADVWKAAWKRGFGDG